MALLAVGSELRAMNVGMTIGALLSNVSEYRLCVASRARYFFVHAAKRVPGAVVIKFGYGANGNPARIRMAIFAGNV
jgi:hypothetical protein